MNNFIKQVIEEKFASKAQQRYFYAQAGKGGKKGKKWAKWAKEFSSKTDFDQIPDKIENENEIEEIVDDKGNIKRGEIPVSSKKSSIGSKERTEKVVKSGAGAMGVHGVHGTHTTLKYWAESKEVKEIAMDDSLGYDKSMGQDLPYKKALKYFTTELGLPEDEAKERLETMGYIPGEEDVVRLVENPNQFVSDYLESVLVKKSKENEIMDNKNKNVNPIILKQIQSLKKSAEKNNMSLDEIINQLKGE